VGGTCVTDDEFRKVTKIVAQNLKKRLRRWENTTKVDFVEILCSGLRGLTILRVGVSDEGL
jgi:hypothetical protein